MTIETPIEILIETAIDILVSDILVSETAIEILVVAIDHHDEPARCSNHRHTRPTR
jgi:hypothetical protein